METTQTQARKRRKLIWWLVAGLALLLVVWWQYPALARYQFLVDRYTEPPIGVDTAKLSELDAACLNVKARDFQRTHDSNNTISPLEWQKLVDRYRSSPEFALAAYNFFGTHWGDWGVIQPHHSAMALMSDVYKSGAADFPLLLRMYLSREQWDWIENLPGLGYISQDVLNDIDYAKLWRKHCPARNSPQGQLERRLLRETRDCAPDQALPLYLEAIQCCREGRTADAQQYLELGNAAPHCDFPAGPPFDEAWAEASQGRAFGGDPALILLINPWLLSNPYNIDLALDRASMLLCAAAVQENNPQLLNDLNVALCRIAAAPPAGFWQGQEIYLGFKHLKEAARERRAAKWIPAPPESFDRYEGTVESLYFGLGGLKCGTAPDHSLDKVDAQADRFTHGKSSQAIQLAELRESGREMIADCQLAAQTNPPILRELQRFDFVSMNWRVGDAREPEQDALREGQVAEN